MWDRAARPRSTTPSDRSSTSSARKNRIVHDESLVRPTASEVSRLCADISKASELLGYAPHVSFEEGLRNTPTWIADHPEAYHPEMYAV